MRATHLSHKKKIPGTVGSKVVKVVWFWDESTSLFENALCRNLLPSLLAWTSLLRLTDCHLRRLSRLVGMRMIKVSRNEDDKGQQRVSEMGEGKEWSRWLGAVSMKVEKAGFGGIRGEGRVAWRLYRHSLVLLHFEMIDLSFKSDSSPGVEVQRCCQGIYSPGWVFGTQKP